MDHQQRGQTVKSLQKPGPIRAHVFRLHSQCIPRHSGGSRLAEGGTQGRGAALRPHQTVLPDECGPQHQGTGKPEGDWRHA